MKDPEVPGRLRLRWRHDAMVTRQVGDELVLLDIESNLIHQFNRTASFIWHEFASASSVEAVAEALATAFEVEQDVALADCVAMTDRLRFLGLLVRVEG